MVLAIFTANPILKTQANDKPSKSKPVDTKKYNINCYNPGLLSLHAKRLGITINEAALNIHVMTDLEIPDGLKKKFYNMMKKESEKWINHIRNNELSYQRKKYKRLNLNFFGNKKQVATDVTVRRLTINKDATESAKADGKFAMVHIKGSYRKKNVFMRILTKSGSRRFDYYGGMKDGQFHGYGELTLPEEFGFDLRKVTYKGNWEDGLFLDNVAQLPLSYPGANSSGGRRGRGTPAPGF